MKIGIDISQVAYQETGVSNYLRQLLRQLLLEDKANEYVLFGSSFRKKDSIQKFVNSLGKKANVTHVIYPFPPSILDIVWNRFHFLPIELFIGTVDIFISSDWTQPPTIHAKKMTILYDLVVLLYPQETARKIVAVQKRRLEWIKKEVECILCISEATKKDAQSLLGIDEKRLKVIYPGI